MDRITLENYRCFREKQSARLAPLTLLVGENSTGKTSFLALIRALWDVAFLDRVPDFREEPFDLGTFSDIAHNRGGRGSRASAFGAGFDYQLSLEPKKKPEKTSFRIIFQSRNATAFPTQRILKKEKTEFAALNRERGNYLVRYHSPDRKLERNIEIGLYDREDNRLVPLVDLAIDHSDGSRLIIDTELLEAAAVSNPFARFPRPFASAPIRSRPKRTYDPTRPSRDPEGEYVPTFLASISGKRKEEWARLRKALEAFGQESGLFNEIDIKLLGKTEGSPFQVQIRKFGHRLKGVKRNLIDVGYGVSQALPLLTELLRKDAPSMYLLQQPEIHLHPSAQAALGSLFCKIAGPNRQLIVETHSNYILDRVRMDIRDKKSDLKPEDISILFFEPGELDVTIHSLRIDQDGNVLDAPPGYGQFFIDETRRSIGI